MEDSFSVITGRSATIPAANLTANDQDSADTPPLTVDWVGEEVGGTATLLANNEDGQGRPLSVVSVGNPVGGSVSKAGDNITFTGEGYAYQPAGLDYTVQNDLGTTATGSVYINVHSLAPIEAYIYHDSDLLAQKLAAYQPPSVQDIFNSWGRFDGNDFFENKDDPTSNSNASAWQFLNNPDRVSMPLNVSPYNGFVSPEKLENYTFEAVLSSPDGDNDTMGLVIAFVRESGTSYGSNGWSGERSAVKIVRSGDLDPDPRLARFKGPQSYGYTTYSQPYSTYLDIRIGGGLDVSKIYDAATGEVWEYVQASGWTLPATDVWDELGFVRQVTNPETGDTYLIKEDEIILL